MGGRFEYDIKRLMSNALDIVGSNGAPIRGLMLNDRRRSERDKRLARHRNTQATHDSVSHTVTEGVPPHVALSESDFIAMQLGMPRLCAAEIVSSLRRLICSPFSGARARRTCSRRPWC